MNLDYEDLEDAERKGYALGFASATAIFRGMMSKVPDEVVKGLKDEIEATVWTSYEVRPGSPTRNRISRNI
ncbi:MAG: hypothetical protein NTY03_04210 [Candidatus Bathyarchaeota archaeon]|nr:hypothetical protein [Candidatus Bathyarchaeota archaeon]